MQLSRSKRTATPWNGLQLFPVNLNLRDLVEPVYRGKFDPELGSRIMCGPAHRLNWAHNGGPNDIVGYLLVNGHQQNYPVR